MTNQSCEAMKQIIKTTTIQLMDYGGTTPEATCGVVSDLHPELYDELGEDQVLDLCKEIHESSEPEESAQLQQLFERFNPKYFGGKLNDFTVLAAYDAAGVSRDPTSGRVDFPSRRIYIQLTAARDCMISILLHHMAHAATATVDDTQREWLGEMQRLRWLGAPVGDASSSPKM